MSSKNTIVLAVLLIIGIVGGIWAYGTFVKGGSAQTVTNVVTNPSTGVAVSSSGCAQNPAVTYVGVNAFTKATITGTDEIKKNGLAPVSTLANPAVGDALQYHLSNASVFSEVATLSSVQCGSGQVIQAKVYTNSSVTLTAYDQKTLIADATHNVTMGANDATDVEITYKGSSKAANMPFGGAVCVDYPTTISSVSLTGAGITGAATSFSIMGITPVTSGNAMTCFEVPMGFDAQLIATQKSLNLNIQAGTSNPSGTVSIVFYPANYYVSNDGNFELGIVKDKNNDNTKTYASSNTKSFGIL